MNSKPKAIAVRAWPLLPQECSCRGARKAMRSPRYRLWSEIFAVASAFFLFAADWDLAWAQDQSSPQTNAQPWAAPARAARKTNPIPADEKSIARGKELYFRG